MLMAKKYANGRLDHNMEIKMNYQDYITIEPDKRGGKPCIRGRRITVSDVLDYLASGMSEDEILADFPDLTREDIKACLAFATDREPKLFLVGTLSCCSIRICRIIWYRRWLTCPLIAGTSEKSV